MPQWQQDEKDYKFHVTNAPYDTFVNVFGVKDRLEEERPKLIIEDRDDNRGPSVFSDDMARNQCIQSLSKSMKIEPHEADWFARDKGGQLYSVDIGYETFTKTDPEYTALVTQGEFKPFEAVAAKKHFPDIEVTEVRSFLNDMEPEKQRGLYEASQAARNNLAEQTENLEEERSDVKSAHEYDVSQEYLR